MESISFKDVINILRKRFLLILFCAIISVSIASVYTFMYVTPIYQSSTQLLINEERSDQPYLNISDIQANMQLINTYNVIIKSPVILERVIEEMNINMTISDLDKKVKVQAVKDSQVVNLSVQDQDPEMATKIANKTAQVFKEEISTLMKVDNVSVLSPASTEGDIIVVSPKPELTLILSLIIGLMIGAGLSFLIDYFDNSFKNEADVMELTGIPVIGIISTFKNSEYIVDNVKKSEVNILPTRREKYGS